VRRHDGVLEIRERPGGTAFVVDLPGVSVDVVAAG
jgi:nitrogen-specific signal transduction histidine kinase